MTNGGGLSIYDERYPAYCECTNLNIRNCKFIDNEAPYGGGIAVSLYGKLNAKDCVFTNNRASTVGGGIYLHFGKPEKDKIRFTRASVQMDSCIFTANGSAECSPIYISDEMPGASVAINSEF